MNNLALKANELVDIEDLAQADIIRMMMKSDNVRESDLRQLCDDVKRELGQYRGSSAS